MIHRLEDMNIDHQIVVVDDNSPDGTSNVVEKLAAKYTNIVLVKREGKLGIATAIRDGMLASSSKYVVVMDSDLQHPPEVVPRILRELKKGKDVAIASRYIRGGKSDFSFSRGMISKVATLLAHINLQETEGIKDPMSGFFGFKRDIIEPEQIKSNGYKVLLEVLVASGTRNVVEVPYRFNKRAAGKSKFGIKEFIRYLKLLLNLSDYLMVKFLVVGISGAILNLLMMKLIVGGFHDPLYMGAILALEASIVSNFILNNYWTYRRRRSSGSVLRKYARYNMMSSLGSAIYFAMIFLLTAFSVNYMLATGIGILASFSTNFGGSQGVVWHL
ncbi:MAG: glycosyltransferase family 2 protein [Candidatus Thermoplasmatota archaeon]|nr:glycosyltransferase family 2 protein [Cuniculiplasma sp.]MCL4320178.1 glycosyltransferase family 2 protein [Candidatus Thermoplasmatota archaeon]MCL5787397.1 glycosyltransferase family 2 protein [Candidatus Thermoplasmatota archaeon]